MTVKPDSGAPGPAVKAGTEEKVQRTQQQVHEVAQIMSKNVESAMERGEQLTDLADKTAALELGAKGFAKHAHKASQNLWWKNLKYWALLIGVVLILLLLIFHKEIFFVLSLIWGLFSPSKT